MIGLLSDGKMDQNFNEGLPVIAQTVAGDLRNWRAGATVSEDADSRIITLGQTTDGTRRLLTGGFLANGQIDSTFDSEGTASVEFLPIASCLHGDGLLVAGTSDSEVQVVRMFAIGAN